MTRALWPAVLLAGLLACGCGRSPPAIVPVEGTLTLHGRPLPHAQIEFVPMTNGLGAQYIATAVTDEQGRFKLTCNGRDGACSGENQVVVRDAPTPEDARGQSAEAQMAATRYRSSLKNRPIPEKYTLAGLSPLSVTVSAERKEYDVKLER